MAREPLSHSQCLRVIGQRLHATAINAFELNKNGDEYTVQIDPNSVVEKLPGGKIVAHGLRQNALNGRAGAVPISFKFTTAEIVWHDDQQKLRRIKPSALPDIGHLSVALRVLGDYLDRNAAGDFTIVWSNYSVKVCHGDKEQVFTAQNFFDLGAAMSLRTSHRAPVKARPPGAR